MRRSIRSGLGISVAVLVLATAPALAAPTAHPLKDVDPGTPGSFPSSWQKLGTNAVFVARDGTHGYEPWISNGTSSGTHMIKDVRQGAAGSVNSTEMVHLSSTKLIFTAAAQAGDGIFVTDGSGPGTKLTKIINPTRGAANVWTADKLLNGAWLFFADDGTHGRELWRSDGTPTGTHLVRQVAQGSAGVVSVNGLNVASSHLAFAEIDDGTHGLELWRTNGTSAGTYLLADINPNGGSNPGELGRLGTDWLFRANDGSHGVSLWSTDGSTGATMIKENPMGLGGTYPGSMSVLNGKGYFPWEDGPDNGTTHGLELWVTNDTTTGTHMAVDIYPGGDGTPRIIGTMGGKLYIEAQDATGWGIWKTDGTPGGTTRVRITHAPQAQAPFLSCSRSPVLNGNLFFPAMDNSGDNELWATNGTSQGTLKVADVNPTGDAEVDCPVLAGSHIYFMANDGTHGPQLWTTDGPENTTRRLSSADGADPYVSPVFLNNGHLFAEGQDAAHGDEPWVYNP